MGLYCRFMMFRHLESMFDTSLLSVLCEVIDTAISSLLLVRGGTICLLTNDMWEVWSGNLFENSNCIYFC